MRGMSGVAFILLLASAAASNAQPSAERPPATVLAVVGEESITEGRLRLFLLARGVPEILLIETTRERFLEQLIERRLIRTFLAREQIAAPDEQITRQVQRLEELLRQQGRDPQREFEKLGLTADQVREELAVPLAWQRYMQGKLTPDRVRDYFQQHRAEFDGTQVRASQIFLKLPENATAEQTESLKAKLQTLADEIAGGRLSFADAARQHSESPSREEGGDVGYFPYRGRMPLWFTQAAFALRPGEVSPVVVSPLGVHLIQATDRKPGDLSLEDVRRQVLERMSEELWNEHVRREREITKVERRP